MDKGREPRTIDALEERVDAVLDVVKPKLRGWLHLAMAPIAFIGGLVLVVLSDTVEARAAAAVFTLTAVLLFAMSAVYHRGNWSPRWGNALKRIDHSNIFLIIAGSYTPFALLLPRNQAITLLAIVWGGAIAGVAFRLLWIHAPRWLYVPVYVALGSVAIFFLGPLLRHAGPTVVTLVITGGALYTIGAIVYGIKRPNPSPQWFGFHEIFHTLTILAFITHYIAASIALYDRV
ncbi:PAQR family membrane homeostasis protein TrhA [Knoellia sp. CPCC 206453]|uniref:PAQR family membrane homeostasis protein TrhA n=1 Tax=Knoellia pratensis TaxID=3404796 RepID=UPI0036168D08